MWRAVVCGSLLGAAVAQNYCDPANCPTETPTVWYGCVTPTVPQSVAPTVPSTKAPSSGPVTSPPSTGPATSPPTSANQLPSRSPTSPTVAPSASPATSSPSMSPTQPTVSPSASPATSAPTMSPSAPPSTSSPSVSPTGDDLAPGEEPTMSPTQPSVSPSASPATSSPSASPATSSPSASPATSSPSASPATSSPSASPATSSPSMAPTKPTAAPSNRPTPLNSVAPTAGPTSSPCLCQVKKGSGFKMPLPTYTCPAVASTPRPVVAPTPLSPTILADPQVSAAVSRPVKVVTITEIISTFVLNVAVSFTATANLPAVSMTPTGTPTATAPDASGNQEVTIPATIDLAAVLTNIALYKLSYSMLLANNMGVNLKQIANLRFRRSGTNDIFGRKASTLSTAVDVLYRLCSGTCDGSTVATAQDDDDSSIIAVAVVVPIVGIMIIVVLVWYFCCSGDDEEPSKTGQHAPYGDQQAEPEEKPDPEV